MKLAIVIAALAGTAHAATTVLGTGGPTWQSAGAGVFVASWGGGAAASGATGGDYTNDVDGYRFHWFTNAGSYTFTPPAGSFAISNLVVAGGGGAGSGGGGAGGVLWTNATLSGAITVIVGDGGRSGTVSTAVAPYNGSNSVCGTLIAYGGGAGGIGGSAGQRGGSGGGASYVNNSTAAGTNGQGFAGGSAAGYAASGYPSGGGGGAGSVGSNAVSSSVAGAGGNGRQINFAGTNAWYGDGGGGALYGLASGGQPGGIGGTGGYGSTGSGGGAGMDGRGGGGGGGSYYGANAFGGRGGKGVVVIGYPYP